MARVMHRLLQLALLGTVVLAVTAQVARADIYWLIDQKAVHVGGFITGYGNASGMKVFLVPVAVAPLPYACGSNTICTPQSRIRPGPPLYTLLGSFRRKPDFHRNQRFRFRVPRVSRARTRLSPGREIA